MGDPQTCTIHAGYARVLHGFHREIDFITKDSKARPGEYQAGWFFRAQYLIKVLDAFAKELEEATRHQRMLNEDTVLPAHLFRSRVLNPIIQRQSRGFPDNTSTIREVAGETPEEAEYFYLHIDPLDPRFIPRCLRGLLYVAPVRFGMVYFSLGAGVSSFLKIEQKTDYLWNARYDSPNYDWKSSTLHDFEIQVIRWEGLEELFAEFTPALVSSGWPLCEYSHSHACCHPGART